MRKLELNPKDIKYLRVGALHTRGEVQSNRSRPRGATQGTGRRGGEELLEEHVPSVQSTKSPIRRFASFEMVTPWSSPNRSPRPIGPGPQTRSGLSRCPL